VPIIGLTDRGPAFPKIGVLRKGGAKVSDRQPGQDLKDHFRLETNDGEIVRAFARAYGEKPNHIRVMLPYATVAENFDTWQEAWTAGALQHRCDGQTCVRHLQKDGTYSSKPVSCPGGCKPAGRLTVWIPDLGRAGVVIVPTTSIHDIAELQSNLEAAEALRGDLRGIPFVLSRRPRKISTPGTDGKRRRMEKWLLSIEPAPDWVRLQLAATARAALPNIEIKALPAPAVDEDTGEIFDDDDQEEDCEAERGYLRIMREQLKDAGGTPWPLTQKQVNAMSCADLRAELDATQAAIDALKAQQAAETQHFAGVADDMQAEYDAIEAAEAAK
jgi:hypothetical protein